MKDILRVNGGELYWATHPGLDKLSMIIGRLVLHWVWLVLPSADKQRWEEPVVVGRYPGTARRGSYWLGLACLFTSGSEQQQQQQHKHC